MENFIYSNKCEIIFGKQHEGEIAKAISGHYAKKVLIVFGSERFRPMINRVTDEIKKLGINTVEYGGVVANPLLNHAELGVKLARDNNVDFILAIGGGSVIDVAKFIAVGAIPHQNATTIFKSRTEPDNFQALSVGAVLTLPAAGSECSTASVVRDDKTGEKFAMFSEAMRPVFAYINPEYCYTLPKEQIGYGASDIFAHLLERYFTSQQNVRFTDYLLEGAMKSMLEIAPKLYSNPKDYNLWAEFCLLGTLAHNDMLALGRIYQDWATHRIENKLLSGVQNIAHGAGLAVLFPAWMRHVYKTKPDRIVDFCIRVIGVSGKNDSDIIDKGIEKLYDFYSSIGLKRNLTELNIDHKIVQNDAVKIFDANTKLGIYKILSLDDILKIIELAK